MVKQRTGDNFSVAKRPIRHKPQIAGSSGMIRFHTVTLSGRQRPCGGLLPLRPCCQRCPIAETAQKRTQFRFWGWIVPAPQPGISGQNRIKCAFVHANAPVTSFIVRGWTGLLFGTSQPHGAEMGSGSQGETGRRSRSPLAVDHLPAAASLAVRAARRFSSPAIRRSASVGANWWTRRTLPVLTAATSSGCLASHCGWVP